MPWLIKEIWNWLWFRHGKVRYRIWIDDDRYIAFASNGDITVYNYGSTPELAKEAALFKIQQALNEQKEKERKLTTQGNGFVLYRVK